jgi:hypothetical protein
MFKIGRLKTVKERKITGSYGRRRAVNPVLINVWELETSEGFPTTAHLSNRSLWFTSSLEESFARSVLYGKQRTEELYLAAETKIRPNNKFDFLKVQYLGLWKTILKLEQWTNRNQ